MVGFTLKTEIGMNRESIIYRQSPLEILLVIAALLYINFVDES